VTRFQFVADHQARYGVKRLCQILKLARSSYYYWKATAPARAARDAADLALIGFLYLATVIDLNSRRLAGWAIADHMRTDLVVDALNAAERTRGSLDAAIMHTGHGRGARPGPSLSPAPGPGSGNR
jgi:transposase InsO family protein